MIIRKIAYYFLQTIAIVVVVRKLEYRLKQKGYGTLKSKHEVLGIITEEYNELIQAITNNDDDNFEEELLDIAVACVFGFACSYAKTLDW